MNIFNDMINNQMLMVAIGVFALCVIIGFFGDIYLKKHNKIGKIFDYDNKNKEDSKTIERNKEESEDITTIENTANAGMQSSNAINDSISSDMEINQTIDNVMDELNTGIVNEPNMFTNIPNNMNQEISDPIVPDLYPPENNISDVMGEPVPFDGQINTDENINNMF